MENNQYQIIQPQQPRPKFNIVSWAGLAYTLTTGVIAVVAAFVTIQVSQSEMRKDFENLKSWAHEQKQERDEKIDKSAAQAKEDVGEVKQELQKYVRKDELQLQTDKLNMILDDTKYLRGRVDELEIRKKNN